MTRVCLTAFYASSGSDERQWRPSAPCMNPCAMRRPIIFAASQSPDHFRQSMTALHRLDRHSMGAPLQVKGAQPPTIEIVGYVVMGIVPLIMLGALPMLLSG